MCILFDDAAPCVTAGRRHDPVEVCTAATTRVDQRDDVRELGVVACHGLYDAGLFA
jgi:hypothetical protein